MKLRLIIPLLLLSLSCSHADGKVDQAEVDEPTLDAIFVQWLSGRLSTEILLAALPESIQLEDLSQQTKIVGDSDEMSLFRRLVLDNYSCKLAGSLAVCRSTDTVFSFQRIDMTQTPWGEVEMVFYK